MREESSFSYFTHVIMVIFVVIVAMVVAGKCGFLPGIFLEGSTIIIIMKEGFDIL